MRRYSRRDLVRAGAATGTILPALTGGHAAAAAQQRPNILLILSDDHSVPHVGCYGNPDIKTPNLDRFAAEGIRFDRAYVTCPQCVPSRASIMSGRSPVGIQMTRFSAPLPREVQTYPELLRAQGYFTGVAGRTYHLDGAGQIEASAKVFDKYKLRTFPDRLDYVKGGNREQGLTQLAEFLDLVPKGSPFFLQLCSTDPHRPLVDNAIPEPHDPAKLKLPGHYPDTKQVREDLARYYDMVSRFDSDFGRIMSILEQRGLTKNTLVAFMGDNGASQLRGKGTLYEYGIHVPLLMRWPGRIGPGRSTTELISGEDLAPTFLEAAGVAPAKGMTGRSFANLLQGKPFDGRKYVFSERGAHGSSLPNGSSGFDLGRCVVGRRHKLVYNALWQLPYQPVDFNSEPFWKELQALNAAGKLTADQSRVYFSPTRPMFELFDLDSDPWEFHNLSGKPETAAVELELKEAMNEWMILERDYLPLPITPIPGQRRPAAPARKKQG
jgi:arylsulfatase A-like enzyme